MSDIYDEHAAVVSLIVDSIKNLRKMNRQHELLSLVKLEDGGFSIAEEQEFNRRYWTPVERNDSAGRKDEHLTYMYSLVVTLGKFETQLRNAIRKELERRLEQNQPLEIGRRVRCYLS